MNPCESAIQQTLVTYALSAHFFLRCFEYHIVCGLLTRLFPLYIHLIYSHVGTLGYKSSVKNVLHFVQPKRIYYMHKYRTFFHPNYFFTIIVSYNELPHKPTCAKKILQTMFEPTAKQYISTLSVKTQVTQL